MIPVFIGWDRVETVAYHVLCHSIISRSSEPVAICPIGNQTLPKRVWWREKGPHDSTDFSNARFAVPSLTDGWAIYMDGDMLCNADIADLWAQRQDKYAVMVVKHNYQPENARKFLGNVQARYDKKNWSSLMLFNCWHDVFLKGWTKYINEAPGLDLHQFRWCADKEIGSIDGGWNTLLQPGVPTKEVPLSHFTEGGPWHGYNQYAESGYWAAELADLLRGDNPLADGYAYLTQHKLRAHVTYGEGNG